MSRIAFPSRVLPVLPCVLITLSGCNHSGGRRLPDPVFVHRPPPPVSRPTPRPLPPLPTPAPPPVAVRPVPLPSRPSAQPGAINPPGGIRRSWKYIVIHHSATDGGGAARFNRDHLARGWDGLGYHFVIGNGSESGDGQIEVGSRWTAQKHGAHCKTPDNRYNDYGIGICLVGNFETSSPTPAQMASLASLVRHLSTQCGISTANIQTHGGITHATACPGRRFSLEHLKRDLSLVAAAP